SEAAEHNAEQGLHRVAAEPPPAWAPVVAAPGARPVCSAVAGGAEGGEGALLGLGGVRRGGPADGGGQVLLEGGLVEDAGAAVGVPTARKRLAAVPFTHVRCPFPSGCATGPTCPVSRPRVRARTYGSSVPAVSSAAPSQRR